MTTETAKVRVTEPQPATASIEQKDYQFLLEENISLLRDIEALRKSAQGYDKSKAELQKQITERDLKLAKSRAFSKIRKFVMLLHVLLAAVLMAIGPTLWILHLVPAEAWWTLPGGITWMVAATFAISCFADEERTQS